MWKKDKDTSYFGLWIKVHDIQTAQKAASKSLITCGFIIFSYVLNFFLVYFYNSDVYGTNYQEGDFLYLAFIQLSIVSLFLFLFIRIKQKRFGSIPFIMIWITFEVIFKLFTTGKGIGIAFFLLFFTYNSLKGYLWLKQKQKLLNQQDDSN